MVRTSKTGISFKSAFFICAHAPIVVLRVASRGSNPTLLFSQTASAFSEYFVVYGERATTYCQAYPFRNAYILLVPC